MLRRFGWRGVVRLAGIGIFVLLVAWAHAATTPAEPGFRNGLSRQTGQNAAKQPLDMSEYDRLLRTYVNDNGWVDYVGLARERSVLNGFLEQLGKVSPSEYESKTEQLAFWINAYNAFTVGAALDTVYGKRHGVREVSGFFDKRKHAVAGEQLTLDEIETRGRSLHDPRIHFAIVCASTSCPKLRRFAYRGEMLNEQLDQDAREFFADAQRGLRFDPEKNELYVSPILKWYAGDFTGSSASAWARVKATVSGSELLDFVARYAPAAVAARIREHPPTLHYFDYDWSLNSLDTHATGSKP